nr:YggS family pyridoxal phosphate-dependent enzyme [Marinicella sp. W31]MDC2879390.1 YggS family pyridoxal phosphate-dependent enzyme [Marinicella sp. W31]
MGVSENLEDVRARIAGAEHEAELAEGTVTLVAVSKTHDADMIREAIADGQRVFGENRVQEAQKKFPELKQETPDIELRLIGPLQSNKAEDAVKLFDVIESVDREKIARALSKEINKQDRAPRLYVQVNTGNEPQKAGIDPRETEAFLTLCREELGLEIEGLMCIPRRAKIPARISRCFPIWRRKTTLRNFPWGCPAITRLPSPSAPPVYASDRPFSGSGTIRRKALERPDGFARARP